MSPRNRSVYYLITDFGGGATVAGGGMVPPMFRVRLDKYHEEYCDLFEIHQKRKI